MTGCSMVDARRKAWGCGLLGALLLAAVGGPLTPVSALAANQAPTFVRVAPIFQEKCQVCHREGQMAPMSLMTYQEVRPWARSIKLRVSLREMPPWHLDKTVGIRDYKHDLSLSDEQVETIVRWVDAGAPRGDPKDLPPPKQWPDDEVWHIGTPDLVVTMEQEHVMPADGSDQWPTYYADTGLTEDRYVKAVETKPSKAGRRIVHHGTTHTIQPIDHRDVDRQGNPLSRDAKQVYLSEFAVNKYGDIFAENTGRLLKAGARISFSMHYHAVGEEVRDRTSVGFVFYPRGYVPKYRVFDPLVGNKPDGGLYDDIDIPPNSVVTHDAYFRLRKPTRILSFQPHMHMRGKAMTMEAVYPDATTEVLSSVDRFDFNWHVAYAYEDDVAPLLPAGTLLHLIATHDNTAANRRNPDPNQWVGFGQRSVDEMILAHVNMVYLDEDDYQRQVAEREAKKRKISD